MAYSQVSFQQLVDQFALRLADPDFKFWVQAEMQAYLIEALRTWTAMSAYLSVNVTVPLTANQVLFDLIDLVPEIAPSVTDRDLISDICRCLQEPIASTSWSGSEQFTYEQIVNAIQRRLDRFLLETGIRLSVSEQASSGNPVILGDEVIDVRRAMWKDTDGNYSVMWKADPIQLMSASPSWKNTSSSVYPPTDYTVGLVLPLSLYYTPQPTIAGTIALVTVNSRGTLNPAAFPTVLGIPDDLCWIIKFGALADIFSVDGPGEDMSRAAYCEARWNDGIKLARIVNVVRTAYINGVPAYIDALSELDQAEPNWVSALADVPQFVAVAQNILAVSPITDNSNPTLTLDITPKFPVPALGDFVQLGKENLDIILDYAEHLAHFKEGTSEITTAMQLYKNMMTMAAVQNDRLRQVVKTFDVMNDKTNREQHPNPRRTSDVDQGVLDFKETN